MSEENQQQQPPAPQGGGEDLIPRAEARAAFEQRDKAKAETRELQRQLEELRGKVKPPAGGSDDEVPGWAKPLVETITGLGAKLQDLEQRNASKEQARTRDGIVDAVLTSVPETQRPTARALLRGLEADGAVKLDGSQAQQDITNLLRTNHGSLFTIPGSTRAANPKNADGSTDWSQFEAFEQVPPELMASMPDEHYVRLRDRSGGAKPMLLRGS